MLELLATEGPLGVHVGGGIAERAVDAAELLVPEIEGAVDLGDPAGPQVDAAPSRSSSTGCGGREEVFTSLVG